MASVPSSATPFSSSPLPLASVPMAAELEAWSGLPARAIPNPAVNPSNETISFDRSMEAATQKQTSQASASTSSNATPTSPSTSKSRSPSSSKSSAESRSTPRDPHPSKGITKASRPTPTDQPSTEVSSAPTSPKGSQESANPKDSKDSVDDASKEDSSSDSTPSEKSGAVTALPFSDAISYLMGNSAQPLPPTLAAVTPKTAGSGEVSDLAIDPDNTASTASGNAQQTSPSALDVTGGALQQETLAENSTHSPANGQSVPNSFRILANARGLNTEIPETTSTSTESTAARSNLEGFDVDTNVTPETLAAAMPQTQVRAPIAGEPSMASTTAPSVHPLSDSLDSTVSPAPSGESKSTPRNATGVTGVERSDSQSESPVSTSVERSRVHLAADPVASDGEASDALQQADLGKPNGMSGANRKSDMRKPSTNSISSISPNALPSTAQTGTMTSLGGATASGDALTSRNSTGFSNHQGNDAQKSNATTDTDPFSNGRATLMQSAFASASSGSTATASEPSITTSVTPPSLDSLRTDLLARAVEFKQQSSTSMTVVLRPDDRTELTVQLRGNEGKVEVQVHMERGDIAAFRNSWESLQHTLSQQGVRLAELSVASGTRQTQPLSTVSVADARSMNGTAAHPGLEALIAASASANMDGQTFSQRDQSPGQRQGDSESHRGGADFLSADGFANSSSGQGSSGRFSDSSNARTELWNGRFSNGSVRSANTSTDTARGSVPPSLTESSAWESWA